MPSIFTKIINNEIPSYKIVENDHFLAFLDAFPLAYGHVLVVPKKEWVNSKSSDHDLSRGTGWDLALVRSLTGKILLW